MQEVTILRNVFFKSYTKNFYAPAAKFIFLIHSPWLGGIKLITPAQSPVSVT